MILLSCASMHKPAWTSIATILVIVVLVGLFLSQKPGPTSKASVSITPRPTSTDTSPLPGLNIGLYPWPPELDNLKVRLQRIGLPALSKEGTVLHTHQHLDIFIEGKSVSVPADIGVQEEAKFISPIHVHDDTNIVHIESPTKQDFTFGQFFDVWGLRFTDSCIGGYCSTGDKTLHLYVNGKSISSNFRDQTLQPYQEIVVTFGNPAQEPQPIPSSFNFPPDY